MANKQEITKREGTGYMGYIAIVFFDVSLSSMIATLCQKFTNWL